MTQKLGPGEYSPLDPFVLVGIPPFCSNEGVCADGGLGLLVAGGHFDLSGGTHEFVGRPLWSTLV